MNKIIYLDHHSTTPLDRRVLDEMMIYFTDMFGNAASIDHPYGYDASMAVESAREKIASLINARRDEIIFTSGATESNNLALEGAMSRYASRGDHMITCVTEHRAVLDVAHHLENIGKFITYLPVNRFGEIDLEKLEHSITDKTVLISIMAANNEIGTIADLAKIGKIAHKCGILFHTDAAQAAGHIPIDVKAMNIDLMSISSHKMYGPKGVGALYIRGIKPRVRLDPIIHGGGQERGLRSGTLNVPAIAGFGKAAEIAGEEMSSENQVFKRWSDIMLEAFAKNGAKLNGHPKKRLPANLNIYFPGIENKAIINGISKQIAISASSACTTNIVEPSHVLLALGLNESNAHSSIRIGMGRFNTKEEIGIAINKITEEVKVMSNLRLPRK